MGTKISIIIPAYNAERYIERCINSLSDQNLPVDEYEAIIINDGSTDQTFFVVKKLSKHHSFIRYISTENNGVSAARNRGVKEAIGEYILFLDADDSISPNCLQAIYREASANNLDMMLMNYQSLLPNGLVKGMAYHIGRNNEKTVSGKRFLLRENYPAMVCPFVYSRSFLLKNNLALIPIRHEDEEFTPRAIYLAQRIKYYPLTFYNYFQNSESFMNSYKESNFYDMITAMHSLNLFKLAHQEDSNITAYFDNHIANRLLMIFKRSIRDGYTIQDRLVEEMKRGGLYPLKPKKPSFYTKLFNYSPRLFEKYYRFMKHKPR